jgi:hypothetical protein
MRDIEKTIEEAKAGLLPYASWERLPGESGAAFAAFCSYRDYGPERNIRKAVSASWKDAGSSCVVTGHEAVSETETAALVGKRYRMWRLWSMKFQWMKRAADYDLYLDQLKQTEIRKTIEEQGRFHRAVTGKMLAVVSKKLDLMEPGELTQGNVTEWVNTAIRAEREAVGLVPSTGAGPGHSLPAASGQLEINFAPDFEGI